MNQQNCNWMAEKSTWVGRGEKMKRDELDAHINSRKSVNFKVVLEKYGVNAILEASYNKTHGA
jgi:hypothetical protein